MGERWTVYKTCFDSDPWCVYNEFGSTETIEYFPTFAEAIRYADHHARTTKNGDTP